MIKQELTNVINQIKDCCNLTLNKYAMDNEGRILTFWEDYNLKEFIEKGFINPIEDLKAIKNGNCKNLARYLKIPFSKAFDHFVKGSSYHLPEYRYFGNHSPLYNELWFLYNNCNEESLGIYLKNLIFLIHSFFMVRKTGLKKNII